MSTDISRSPDGYRLPAEDISTLVDLLRWRTLSHSALPAYRFLLDGETEEGQLSYQALDERARAIGAWLQEAGAAGERVLLLYPPGLEFITAFFGCLYAGAVAVPAYPPRANRTLLRLQAIASDAEAKVALTNAATLAKVDALLDQAPQLKGMLWLATEDAPAGLAETWRRPDVNSDTLAFLQYTSGSTALPKGVMVSHGNLMHNERLIQQACEHTEQSTFVGWLPLYHDMGLIGNVFQPIYLGAACVLMSPVAFLQRPLRWLEAISRYRAATSGGPNFAYDLCVRKITSEQRASLDLSSWTIAFNGAEPVRAETMERFAAAFQDCGFRRQAFYPCYGLAEATLFVSGGHKDAEYSSLEIQAAAFGDNQVKEANAEDEAQTLISCGRTLLDQRLIIVDPQSLQRCSSEQVGEIWLAGQSVAQGYWNKPEETQKTFRAYIAETGDGPYLRTGDLGFIREGELFVTGRLKDLIIIRGRNHYPQDIELTVERCHAALRPGCGAAFSVELEREERLAITQEIDHRQQFDPDEVFDSIRRAVADEHELQPHIIVLLKSGSIPKTSSGKIQRHACRAGLLAKSLGAIALWQENEATQAETSLRPLAAHDAQHILGWLVAQLAAHLSVVPDKIDINQSITRCGLDSLMAVELSHRIETELGITLPSVSLLQDQSIAQLADALSAQLLGGNVSPQPLAHVLNYDATVHPLSHGQQALWFLHQLAPESAAYNIASAARIHAELDVPAFERAFQSLVERHASLRTTFNAIEGKSVQVVHEQIRVSVREEDARDWSDDLLKSRLAEDAEHPFDLHDGPLLRVALFKRSRQEHVLLLTVHHIIADFWSLAVLIRELGILYQAESNSNDAPVALDVSSLNYLNYVYWQQEMLAGAQGERLWQYWQKQLAGELPVLNLPLDAPRPTVQTYTGALQTFHLSEELTEKLKGLSREQGATLYMTLLAAFQAMLARYTGQEDILVGSPVAGRTRAEWNNVAGYFVNLLVMRADLSANPSFKTFLGRVRQTVLDAFEHQDYPLALLIERLQVTRDPSRSPLFQAMFVLQKSHLQDARGLASVAVGETGAEVRLGELVLESMALEQRTAQFDLTLMMAEEDGKLKGAFEYNTDLFEPRTIAHMAEHFATLLAGIAADAGQRLSELPLISQSERSQLLVDWNDTSTDYNLDVCLHELFEAQAARTPHLLALQADSERLTYHQLNERANQLAHYLRGAGVGPEALVGVFMQRSVEMVVALLAVLKAGGAYVPLEPEYPAERIRMMLEDASPKLLLTQQSLRAALPETDLEVISLDTEWQKIARESVERNAPAVKPEHPAYVIYTSGSTGQPKGAVITHRGICNRLLWMQEAYQLTEADRVLQKTPFSFDVSVWEFFWPLLTGACLVMAQPQGHKDSAYLVQVIAEEKITTIHFVPSMLHVFLEEAGLSTAQHLKRIICSGQALTFELQERLFAAFPANVEIYNLYGPTEASVDVTAFRCQPGGKPRSVSIGRPIANTQIYLLDAHLHPVPIAVPGELHIGGVGLARGYLNRPALTAEKFIPNPFSLAPGARLYKTGDLARLLPDGNIDFLGRLDHQVKVRGFRIELEEIEAVLDEHPAIGACIVLAREDVPGQQRLIAYVVAAKSHAISVDALRQFLQERLPDYMIPAAFVMLEALPLTPNGKVNRQALPTPDLGARQLEEAFVAARTPTEELLVSIWREVLGVEQVGIHDNFFALGGDSILAIQVIAKARQAGLELTPRQLIQRQTVQSLALALPAQMTESEQGPVSGALPLTPVQHWFVAQDLAEAHHFNQAVLLETKQALDPLLLERAVAKLLAHHDALRLRLTRDASGWQQVNAACEASVPLTRVDLSGVPEQEQATALEAVTAGLQASLNLAEGPLMRAALINRAGGQTDLLLLIVHHLAIDGVSWRILLEDLQTAYQQLSLGEAVELMPKTTSFKRWAESLVEYAQSAIAGQEMSYWLAEARARLTPLPVDYPAGANTEQSTRTFTVSLSAEETAALLHEAPSAYGTQINDVLLAALAQTFTRWTGEKAVLVDIEGHGREEIVAGIDLSRTVGWFTSIAPLLLESHETDSPGELLKFVKEQLRRIPNNGLGYGVLRYLNRETAAKLQALPTAEVVYNYLGQFDQVLRRLPLFGLAKESSGPPRSPRAMRRYLLNLDGSIIDECLRVDWTYSTNVHRRATIERLAEDYRETLRSLIRHCRSAGQRDYTPSDFPLAGLRADQLASVLSEIEFD